MSNVHPPTTGAGRVNHGTKPLGLNEKSKAALKNRSSDQVIYGQILTQG